ncbi:hypothetical protein B4135_2736 [Caldibacillus debilis]|uniref:Uncharacterized protein n=1 Tax=Caldibacillus debilis TaxID=301148 RepID=A0A150LSB9_9BACI|nr:hypothetical protein B4135_2736 [Caldibacillus debilis]
MNDLGWISVRTRILFSLFLLKDFYKLFIEGILIYTYKILVLSR